MNRCFARRVAAVVLTGLAGVAGAAAHDGLHEQLERLDAYLRENPGDADAWLQRAEAWRHAGHPDLALDDVARAEAADPDGGVRHGPRAAIQTDRGCHAEALDHVDHALAARPHDAGLWRLRAEALTGLSRPAQAADAWDMVVTLDAHPSPDDYAARLDAVLRTGDTDRALGGIEQATARLGLVPLLQQRALELHMDAGRVDVALLRLDALATGAKRQEQWLARRGDLLARAGRHDEAREAWSAALQAIDRLGRRHRETAAVAALQEHLHRELTQP